MGVNSRSADADDPQFIEHFLVMRCRPVNPPASRAPGEFFLGRKNVPRHDLFYGFLGSRLQRRIALDTARERVVTYRQAARPDHLRQLFAKLVAFDEYERRRLLFFQASVSGQDQAVLGARRADQAMAGQMPAVDHVLTGDAQPSGEPAEHEVGGKSADRGACLNLDHVFI